METIFWIIGFLFSVWLLISPLVCLYWVFRPAEWFWWKHKYISGAIGIGGFLSCAFVISHGARIFLWFIPHDWVYENSEGESKMVKISIAALIGLSTTIALLILLSRTCEEKRRRESEDRIAWRITRKKSNLHSMDRSEQKQAIEEFKRRKQELEKLLLEEKTSPFQKEERMALDQLLEELDK